MISVLGIVCNLPARTAVIAAANPHGGHYNKAKTVAENLKISAPLLSRFDLVFILLDKPDEARDLLLSEHVMMLHSKPRDGDSQQPQVKRTCLPPSEPQSPFLSSWMDQRGCSPGRAPAVLLSTLLKNKYMTVYP